MEWMSVTIVAINLLALLLMGCDKYRAKRHWGRISESTLFTVAVLGGAPGILLGTRLFHHKIRKPLFRFGVPFVLAGQAVLLWRYLPR